MAIPLMYSVRNTWTRKWTSLLTAGGMALVTFVFTAVLMLAEGLEKTMVETGSPENVVVLRGSAETEISSVVDRDAANIVIAQPEVAQNAGGDPLASKEAVVLVTLPKNPTGSPTNVAVRGAGAQSAVLRPHVTIAAGRWFRPGAREIVVGKSIAERIRGAALGGTLTFAMTEWTIVGVMHAGGTAFDSEIWADVEQLMNAFRRYAYSVALMRVPGAESFSTLKARLEHDPRLSVQVKREPEFYRRQSEVMTKFITILGMAMTSFFSIGAVLGAMVTMYSAVANRTREIGTLRALGFSRPAIMAAFLMESLFLGIVGGGAGVLAGSSLQFITISTLNWETFSELAFSFALTPRIAMYSMAFALTMGFVGGALPSWRAARLKIVDALR
jgi:ABC-type antimicrobial peptide transport system permease subunit